MTSKQLHDACRALDSTLPIEAPDNLETELQLSLINFESIEESHSASNIMLIPDEGEIVEIQISKTSRNWQTRIPSSSVHVKIEDTGAILLLQLKGILSITSVISRLYKFSFLPYNMIVKCGISES